MDSKILKNRSLVLIGIAETVSGIGNWITMMAVFAMVVFNRDGTIVQSSAIFLAGLVPTLIASPIAGWLSDRYDRKKLMIVSEILSGAITTVLIFTHSLSLIYVILALQAITISIMSPARQAAVPDLVEKTQLSQANAFLQQLSGLTKIFAPMFAGMLLTILTPNSAIILDVISFFISALLLSTLPALMPHKLSKIEQEQITKSSGVISTIRKSRSLQLLFLSMFIGIFVIIGFDVLAPIFIRDVLAGNEQFFGLAIGSIGLGTVIASMVLMLRKNKNDPWKDFLIGLLLIAIIPAVMGLTMNMKNLQTAEFVILFGCFVGGVGNGFITIQVSTLLQLITPPNLLGRISGVFQATAVSGQLGGLLLTPLLIPALISMKSYFYISAVAILLLFVFVTVNYNSRILGRLEFQKNN